MARNLYPTSVGPKAQKPQYEERARTKEDSERFKAYCEELAAKVQAGDPDGVVKLLDYFSGKAQFWSPYNMMFLAFQGVGHPVTVSELGRFNHRLKPGAELKELMVPIILGESRQGKNHAEEDAREDAEAEPEEIQGKGVKSGRDKDRLRHDPPFTEERQKEVKTWLAENEGRLEGLKAIFNLENPQDAEQPKEQREEYFLRWVNDRYRSQIDRALHQGERKTGPKVGFKMVKCVADLGKDTVGEPLLDQGTQEGQAHPRKVYAILRKYAANLGIEVTENTANGANGIAYMKGSQRCIGINPALADSKKVGTLIHEIAHHLLDLKEGKQDSKESKEIREMRAEAVSYVVTKELRVPNQFSTAYLKCWGATARDIQSNLLTIAGTAKEISLGIAATQRKLVQEIMAARQAAAAAAAAPAAASQGAASNQNTASAPVVEESPQESFDPVGIIATAEGPVPVAGGNITGKTAIFFTKDGRKIEARLNDDNQVICDEGEIILVGDLAASAS
jgi:hypothetical protein